MIDALQRLSDLFRSGYTVVVVLAIVSGSSLTPSSYAAEWELTGPPGGELREIEIAGDTIWIADGSRLHVRRGAGEWQTIVVEAGGQTLADIQDLEVDPTDPERLGVSGSSAAFFSTDGGATWHLAPHQSDYPGVPDELRGEIDWDPRGGAAYIAANECSFDFAEQSGVFRSDADLREWTRISGGCVSDTTIDPTAPDTIWAKYAWSPNTVSRDGGVTWSESGQPHPFEIVVDPFDSGVKYATGGASQAMRSLDDGLTWEPLPYWLNGPPDAVRLSFAPNGTLLAIVPNAFFPATLYALGDGWEEVYVPFARATDIATNADGEVFVTGSLGLVKTEEWPPEWQAVVFEYSNRPVISLAADPLDPDRVVTSVRIEHDFTSGQVFRSESHGERWDLVSFPGLPIPARYQVVIDSAGTLFAMGPISGQSRLYRLKRGEAEWTQLPLTQISSLLTAGGRAYAASRDEIVPLGPGAAIPVPGGLNDFAVAQSGDEEVLLSVAGWVLYSSTDGGASWAPVEGNGKPLSIEAAPSDSSVVYLISQLPMEERPFSRIALLRSSDGGKTWSEGNALPSGEPAMTPGFLGDGDGIAVHPLDPLTLCVTSQPDLEGNGALLHCSFDGGQTWAPFDDGFVGGTVLEFNATGTWLYAGSPAGVQRLRFAPSRRRAVERTR